MTIWSYLSKFEFYNIGGVIKRSTHFSPRFVPKYLKNVLDLMFAQETNNKSEVPTVFET